MGYTGGGCKLIRTAICDICGKEYIKPAEQLYKINYKGKNYRCCSYTCYRIVQKVKEGDAPEETLYESKNNSCV